MKRNKILAHLRNHKCLLFYEGRRHSVYLNPKNDKTSTIPRHREIVDGLANKICKDLGIPRIKK